MAYHVDMVAVRHDDHGRHDAAVEALVDALRAVGLGVDEPPARHPRDPAADLVVDVDGRRLVVEVKVAASVDGGRASRLTPPADGVVGVVVADRVTAEARTDLSAAGWSWLDRRGHLRLRAPGVVVDAEVPAAASVPRPAPPIAGRGAMSVAYWLLTHPGRAIAPTKQVDEIGYSPATISRSVTRLAEAGLVGDDGTVAGTELFWALADVWRPERVWLADVPSPRRDPVTNLSTYRLTGDVAAAALGAPIVVPAVTTLDLYVGGPVELTIAQRRWGTAPPGAGAAALAVAPVGAVVGPGAPGEAGGWSIAPLLAVALHLATDRGRGREALLEWAAGDGIWR